MHSGGEEVRRNLGALAGRLEARNGSQQRNRNVKTVWPRILHGRRPKGYFVPFYNTFEALDQCNPIIEVVIKLKLKLSCTQDKMLTARTGKGPVGATVLSTAVFKGYVPPINARTSTRRYPHRTEKRRVADAALSRFSERKLGHEPTTSFVPSTVTSIPICR